MRWKRTLRLPKEHGAWGMLYIPFLLGAFVAAAHPGRMVLLGLSMTFVFIGRESLLAWWRARARGKAAGSAPAMASGYMALAGAAAAPLVIADQLYGILPLAALTAALLLWNGGQAAKREERTMTTEITGIAGLCLAAPAAHYTGAGSWQPTAAWLWLACVLYFVSSVFYVKLRVLTAHAKRPEPLARIRWQCAAYHATLAALALALVAGGWWHWFLLPAYAPVTLRAFWHLARPARSLVLKQVGYLEVAYSIVFLVCAALGF